MKLIAAIVLLSALFSTSIKAETVATYKTHFYGIVIVGGKVTPIAAAGLIPLPKVMSNEGWKCMVTPPDTLPDHRIYRNLACEKGDSVISASAACDTKNTDSDATSFALNVVKGEVTTTIEFALKCRTVEESAQSI